MLLWRSLLLFFTCSCNDGKKTLLAPSNSFSQWGGERAGNVVELNGHQKALNYLARVLYIRNFVSKKRRRMLIAGYDLDMSYITSHLLAMSYPAQSMRAVFRNPLWQVKSVLDMRHSDHYKVYNLCAEETYDPSHFHDRVEGYPFDDNYVPSLGMIQLFCESVYAWLLGDPQNIAVIHCMAGKGRTGLMICAYLVYSGMTAEAALQLYAERRTTNNQGVSIPSQRRYVGYWSKILSFLKGKPSLPPRVNLPEPSPRELRRIRLYDTININSVFFVVSELQQVAGHEYHPPVEVIRSCCRPINQGNHRPSSPRYFRLFVNNGDDENKVEETLVVVQMDTESSVIDQKTCLDCYFETPVLVSGDVRVSFFERMIGGRLFYACFNTAFIKSSLLQLPLLDLDKVGRRGKAIAGPAFFVELLFGPANSVVPESLIEGRHDDS